MGNSARGLSAGAPAASGGQDALVIASRCFSWGVFASTCAFLLNNYLTNWRGWPGATAILTGGPNANFYSGIQFALYVLGLVLVVGFVLRTPGRGLRPDSETMYAVTAFIVRGCFWSVLFVGLADMVISFLRVEGFLPGLFGDALATDLGRSSFRGAWVHFPLVALGFVIAIFKKGLGFPWLALLVVLAELLIVFTRFIFSYEQAFMADLVRFWYAALFLFASAYTLLEEGHVRVDVLYSAFDDRTKGLVNAIGSVLLGISLCAVIMYYGMESRSTVINGPLLLFETTPTGFGMYVKYWMAGFLGIFAITMQIQFAGYFMEGIADWRGDPGKRVMDMEAAHVA